MPNTAESTAVCVICGKEFPPARMEKFCGRPICRSCLATETFLCACCGRRIPWSERAASSGGGICQACFDERFTHCCICGRVLRQSEAHWRGGGWCGATVLLRLSGGRPGSPNPPGRRKARLRKTAVWRTAQTRQRGMLRDGKRDVVL